MEIKQLKARIDSLKKPDIPDLITKHKLHKENYQIELRKKRRNKILGIHLNLEKQVIVPNSLAQALPSLQRENMLSDILNTLIDHLKCQNPYIHETLSTLAQIFAQYVSSINIFIKRQGLELIQDLSKFPLLYDTVESLIQILQLIESCIILSKHQAQIIRDLVDQTVDTCQDLKVLEISFCLAVNLIRKYEVFPKFKTVLQALSCIQLDYNCLGIYCSKILADYFYRSHADIELSKRYIIVARYLLKAFHFDVREDIYCSLENIIFSHPFLSLQIAASDISTYFQGLFDNKPSVRQQCANFLQILIQNTPDVSDLINSGILQFFRDALIQFKDYPEIITIIECVYLIYEKSDIVQLAMECGLLDSIEQTELSRIKQAACLARDLIQQYYEVENHDDLLKPVHQFIFTQYINQLLVNNSSSLLLQQVPLNQHLQLDYEDLRFPLKSFQ